MLDQEFPDPPVSIFEWSMSYDFYIIKWSGEKTKGQEYFMTCEYDMKLKFQNPYMKCSCNTGTLIGFPISCGSFPVIMA